MTAASSRAVRDRSADAVLVRNSAASDMRKSVASRTDVEGRIPADFRKARISWMACSSKRHLSASLDWSESFAAALSCEIKSAFKVTGFSP